MNQKVLLDLDDTNALLQCLQVSKHRDAVRLIAMLQSKMKSTPVMDLLRAEGIEHYVKEGEIEIDEGAVVSIDDTPGAAVSGAYVNGWVWVELPIPEPFEIPGLGCKVVGITVTHYRDNDKAMAVTLKLEWPPSEDNGGQVTVEDHALSVNIPEAAVPNHLLPEGEFYAKNWSENEKLYQACLEHRIIEEVEGKSATSGFITAPVCRLSATGKLWADAT